MDKPVILRRGNGIHHLWMDEWATVPRPDEDRLSETPIAFLALAETVETFT